jgi:hypothetical protein
MIDSYSFGRTSINGKEYRSDVIIFQDRVEDEWWRKEGHRLHIEDVEHILQEGLDVLVIGTGAQGMMEVLPETKRFFESRGIELIIEKTAVACKIYNDISVSKKVVATLHLTC